MLEVTSGCYSSPSGSILPWPLSHNSLLTLKGQTTQLVKTWKRLSPIRATVADRVGTLNETQRIRSNIANVDLEGNRQDLRENIQELVWQSQTFQGSVLLTPESSVSSLAVPLDSLTAPPSLESISVPSLCYMSWILFMALWRIIFWTRAIYSRHCITTCNPFHRFWTRFENRPLSCPISMKKYKIFGRYFIFITRHLQP